MTDLDLSSLLDAAETAARVGGRIVADRFGAARDVRAKAPGDYVSEADLASEAAVRDELATAAPDIAFFGEELGGERGDRGWIVDPLDGTANFLHGFPVVGVSVALVDGGRPVVAAVHAPLLGLMFTAAHGRGAYGNGAPITVAARDPAHAICGTGFPFKARERRQEYLDVFAAALGTFEDLRRAGAATLDLAWTAAGVFDGFFELSLAPWDVAAGALLVREAGGVVTDWRGDPDAWLTSGDIVAGPPQVHAVLLGLCRRAV